jgi:sugar-specific transcriptional regulator TrmB
MSENVDEKGGNKYLKSLVKIGLTEKESVVYLSLLQLGEVGSSKIIDHTGLHGQFVYDALKGLDKHELIQVVKRNGRKKFSALNPRSITNLIDSKKRIAEDLATKLQNFYIPPKDQSLEMIQGDESYIEHEFELLQKARPDSELLVIGGSGDSFIKIMWSKLQKYEEQRLAKSIKIRYVGSEQQRREFGSNCGYGLVVECVLAKDETRVRFSLPALSHFNGG